MKTLQGRRRYMAPTLFLQAGRDEVCFHIMNFLPKAIMLVNDVILRHRAFQRVKPPIFFELVVMMGYLGNRTNNLSLPR